MEYKRSRDGGKTWGDPQVLDYSKELFDAGQEAKSGEKKLSAFAEKAVLTDAGDIAAFFLVCDITEDTVWRRFQVPTYIRSGDGGVTWSHTFRVLAVDYDTKDQPRLAIGPGRYELGNGVRLVIVGRGHALQRGQASP